MESARALLRQQRALLIGQHPTKRLEQQRNWLAQQRLLLQALSPQHLLARGFSLLRNQQGQVVRSLSQLEKGAEIEVQIVDGRVRARVEQLLPDGSPSAPDPPGSSPGSPP